VLEDLVDRSPGEAGRSNGRRTDGRTDGRMVMASGTRLGVPGRQQLQLAEKNDRRHRQMEEDKEYDDDEKQEAAAAAAIVGRRVFCALSEDIIRTVTTAPRN